MIIARSVTTSFYGVVAYVVMVVGVMLTACSQESAPTQPEPQHLSVQDTTGQIHVEFGIPTDADDSDDFIIIRRQYALSYNRNLNVPNWVSWNLNAEWFGDVPRHSGNFITDATLPSEFYRVKHSDYTNGGYDRGHMVRSEERTKNVEDNRSTFLLTNILPQAPDLNQGVWLDFERWCEAKCKNENMELYIIAGGIFHIPHDRVNGVVAIPDSCFKIVVVMSRGEGLNDADEKLEVVAAVFPNISGVRRDPWEKYISTVERIQRSTGYDFLSLLDDEIEAQIERGR